MGCWISCVVVNIRNRWVWIFCVSWWKSVVKWCLVLFNKFWWMVCVMCWLFMVKGGMINCMLILFVVMWCVGWLNLMMFRYIVLCYCIMVVVGCVMLYYVKWCRWSKKIGSVMLSVVVDFEMYLWFMLLVCGCVYYFLFDIKYY